jgi:hypothetical protein
MKVEKNNDGFFVLDEDGSSIGWGETPLEAAKNAASELHREQSYFWLMDVCSILEASDPKTINC